MSNVKDLLAKAEAASTSNPKQAEQIYKQILAATSSSTANSNEPARDEEHAQGLRDQEVALVKLGELYRDHKCVYIIQLLQEIHY